MLISIFFGEDVSGGVQKEVGSIVMLCVLEGCIVKEDLLAVRVDQASKVVDNGGQVAYKAYI